jgi:cation:H+ antiporter
MGFWQLLGIGVSCFVLVMASRIVIDAFRRLVVKAGWEKMTVAAVLVALFTTMPEFFVGVASALEGKPLISLGNVIGSNVANLSLIIGGAALVSGSVNVVGEFIRWEMAAALIAGLAPAVLMIDGDLSRLDGVVLLIIYAFYLRDLFMMSGHHKMVKRGLYRHAWVNRIKVWHKNHVDRLVVKLIAGLLVMLLAADMVVKLAVSLAGSWQIPIVLVSLLVVAVGTSLPELVLEIEAIRKKEVALAFGDLLGSVVANSSLILGVTVLISPIRGLPISSFGMMIVAFLVVFGFFWLFVSTKKRLDRWEGVVLMGLYLMFVGWQLLIS